MEVWPPNTGGEAFVFVLCKWLLTDRLTSQTKLLTAFDIKEGPLVHPRWLLAHFHALQDKQRQRVTRGRLDGNDTPVVLPASLQKRRISFSKALNVRSD